MSLASERSPSKPPYRVQLLVDGRLEYFREVVLGVRQYGFSSGRLTFADRWLAHESSDLAALVRRDRIDGIVAAVHAPRELERLRGVRVPVVNVSNSVVGRALPLVTQDDVAVGRLAAEHLAATGARAWAFCGQAEARYAEERWRGFCAGVRAAGGARVVVSRCDVGGESSRTRYRRLRAWLRGLPARVGVFAVLDEIALELLRAARELGRAVPEDVAVLGAGNDDFWVEFESVPLSSVRLPARAIGVEAGRAIEALMASRRRTMTPRRLPVTEVVARRSTDVVFVADEAVARAARYIRSGASANPYVADVVRAAGISRSALQARFKAALGRTVLDEIRRVRIERAQGLLRTTDVKMTVVAERCGFPNSQRFSVLFRQVTGMSPRTYRRAARG